MNIYIVTDGEYSDYHICRVFLKKENAEFYIRRLGGTIEVWNVGVGIEKLKQYKNIYLVRLDEQGNVKEITVKNTEYYFDDALEEGIGYDDSQNIFVSVLANSEEEAIKVAKERRASFLGENNITWKRKK